MPITILLVDDHAVVRSGLSKFLMVNKDLKLVGEASDGAEAVQMVSLHRPDIVLMDLMMPAMDGLTMVRALQKIEPSLRFIVSSGLPETYKVSELSKSGQVEIIEKPYSPEKLLTDIQEVIRPYCKKNIRNESI